ncbi:MAG: 50S ribosomal protein L9 [Candidatus Omnitrophica bacterium]|nr:50S ribosomal protein L9 [Candidatus Omnitrophota bacterium]
MEIILSQNVDKLGRVGDVVKVKDGFARNYLLPKNMGIAATAGNLKRVALLKAKEAAAYEERKKEARAVAEKLAKVSITIAVEVNDLDKLYGSVTETEILNGLEQEGYTFERHQLVIEKPIDELGIFEIGINLHPEVKGKFRLWVTKK